MPNPFDHEAQPKNPDNRSGARARTWKDERQDVTSFAGLNHDSAGEFLVMIGYLFGVCVDSNTGPKRMASQVAFLKAGRRACFHETTELDIESIITHNQREAHYTHRGWHLSNLSLDLPWIRSRISRNNQPNHPEVSITKRVFGYRLRVDVLLKDLSPVPEFENEVRDALGMPTRFEKFQALYQVFESWGDVVPLSLDVGTSLTVTDLKSNHDMNPIELHDIGLWRVVGHKTAKVLVQGIDGSKLSNTDKWWICSSDIPVGRWSQIRVTKVAPVTALLSTELQARLSQLHNSLITYRPPRLGGDTNNGYAFDDASYALKTIKSITFYCTDRVNSLCVAYSDGTLAQHGTDRGSASTFDLDVDEYIFEIHVWGDSNGVSSVKFLTSRGRTSHAFGGAAGTLAIFNSTGGFLTALAGKIQNDVLSQLQGIWRHDIRDAEPNKERKYSKYYGTGWGNRFDELPLLEHPHTAISKIKVRSAGHVYAIQLTYSYKQGDHVVIFEGPRNGGAGGTEGTFDLSPGEYITTIRERLRPNIGQLCFATNLGE